MCAHTNPVSQAIVRNTQTFFTVFGQRVVKAQAFDEAAIAAHALVGDDDVEEGTGLGAAARKTNNDHDVFESCGW